MQRRYSEFRALHRSLSKCFDNGVIGNIPKKILFGNFKQEKLVRRKMQLQIFLGRIVMVDHPDVKTFLGVNNKDEQISHLSKPETDEKANQTNVFATNINDSNAEQ